MTFLKHLENLMQLVDGMQIRQKFVAYLLALLIS